LTESAADIFAVDHAASSVKLLNRVSKGGEHPLCDILISGGVKTPLARRLRLLACDFLQPVVKKQKTMYNRGDFPMEV
jgi:hypothetical protein